MNLILLVLRCRDLEKTKEFYEKLGLKFETDHDKRGAVFYSAYVGDTVLELHLSDEWYRIKRNTLAFYLDIEDIYIFLDDANIKIEYRYMDEGVAVAVVFDPDGRNLRIYGE